MTALLNATGIGTKGTVPEMMQLFSDYIKGMEASVLLFDDADQLKDRVLHLLVLLANSIAGSAGVVIMGGEKLRARIIEGVRLKKTGYDEIYKSIGRRFITLGCPGPKDIELVCRANGIFDEETINHIKEGSNNNLHHTTQLITEYSHMDLAA